MDKQTDRSGSPSRLAMCVTSGSDLDVVSGSRDGGTPKENPFTRTDELGCDLMLDQEETV